MSLNVIYSRGELQYPIQRIKNNVLIINLPSQHYIDQEAKKLDLAKKSFNDPMIDKMYKAFQNFISN